jgi:DNA-directed RNA polymerase specialized sigma24 family protein
VSNCVGNPDLDSYFDAVYAETFNSVSKFVVSHAARFQDSEDIIQNVYTRFYKRSPKRASLISNQRRLSLLI